jgi:hypothetical protein
MIFLSVPEMFKLFHGGGTFYMISARHHFVTLDAGLSGLSNGTYGTYRTNARGKVFNIGYFPF